MRAIANSLSRILFFRFIRRSRFVYKNLMTLTMVNAAVQSMILVRSRSRESCDGSGQFFGPNLLKFRGCAIGLFWTNPYCCCWHVPLLAILNLLILWPTQDSFDGSSQFFGPIHLKLLGCAIYIISANPYCCCWLLSMLAVFEAINSS